MNHVGLFEGSGIPSLCAASVGMETVAIAESDPWCCYALERLYPNAKLFRDVRDVSTKSLRECGVTQIDVISGGFPCQDLSCAGKGAGIEGSRSGLWREMFRIIRQVRPAWIVAENVPAIKMRGVDRVIAPLERIGYTVWPLVVGAWSVGAPHKRDRVWIVAHSAPGGQRKDGGARGSGGHADECGEIVADAYQTGREIDAGQQSDDATQRAAAIGGGGIDELANAGGGTGPGRSPQPWRESLGRIATRWPSRPGERQHGWERPRLAQFGVGCAVDGLAGRIHPIPDEATRRILARANKAGLRLAGNGWCFSVAKLIFQWIAEQEESK